MKDKQPKKINRNFNFEVQSDEVAEWLRHIAEQTGRSTRKLIGLMLTEAYNKRGTKTADYSSLF